MTDTIQCPTYDDFGYIIGNNRSGTAADMSYAYDANGAYGKGFVQSLVDYAKENGIEHKIEFELDLAPFQPTGQKAVDGVPTYQASHTKQLQCIQEQI